jgi:hypothetical protein
MTDYSTRPAGSAGGTQSQQVMGNQVNATLLQGTLDYPRWAKRVQQLLRSKGLLQFVLTDDKTKLSSSSPMKRRSNKEEPLADPELDQLAGKAMLIIIDNIAAANRYLVDDCDGDPKRAWDALHRLYGARSDSVRMTLRQKLHDIQFQHRNEPVTYLIRRVAECVLRLRDFGTTIDDNDHITLLIDKIQRHPDWYEKVSRLSEQHVRTPYSVGDFVSELHAEHERRDSIRTHGGAAGIAPQQSVALITYDKNRNRGGKDTLCFNCLKHGHSAGECKTDCRICAVDSSRCPHKTHRDRQGGAAAYITMESDSESPYFKRLPDVIM